MTPPEYEREEDAFKVELKRLEDLRSSTHKVATTLNNEGTTITHIGGRIDKFADIWAAVRESMSFLRAYNLVDRFLSGRTPRSDDL